MSENPRMLRSGRRHVLFPLVLALMVMGAPSMAHGGHLRHHGDKSSGRIDQERDQDHGKPTVFVASIDGMIRACAEQAAALRKLPPETIVQAVQLSDDQRAALEQVQTSADSAAKALDANCPKSIPAELSAKLDTLDNVLSLLADSLSGLRPALLKFHASLDDEQKGRLVAMSRSSKPAPRSGRTGTRKGPAAGGGAEEKAKSICTQWAAILRTWPVRQFDTQMQLSDAQRAALYELSAAIYRSAGDLVEACPAENPVTPYGHLDARQNELQALREDIKAIRPPAAAFENALNEVQKKPLALATDSETHWSGGMTPGHPAREIVSQSSGRSGKYHGGLKNGPMGHRFGPARWPQWGFAYVPHWHRY
jgi:hypothetical protein